MSGSVARTTGPSAPVATGHPLDTASALSLRPWILALALVACRDGGSGSAALVLQSISVPDFGSWESNRPIEFAFNQRIDFATVSSQSIRIRTFDDVPAAGTFEVKTLDGNGDGVPEASDERVVVFYPRCPLAGDLSDAGLVPGVRYLVAIAGEDSGQDPASLLRSASGKALLRSHLQVFETIADPASALHDEKAGAPPRPLLRRPGASVGPGCHLELGPDPATLVFFEGDPLSGRPPAGFSAPLNVYGDPAARVAFVLVFDQLIDPGPANLARLSLEYDPTSSPGGWTPLATRAELVANCRPDGVAVRLVPLGAFPAGGSVRARIQPGFRDVAGEATPAPADEFAITDVATVAYASLDPAGAVAGEIREEFDFGPESPLSLADPAAPPDATPALWGGGELRANDELIVLPPELREFDWTLHANQVLVFDTNAMDIAGGPGGFPTMIQHTTGGRVFVRDLVIGQSALIIVQGPNPLVIHASGSVTLDGTLQANGVGSTDLFATQTTSAVGGAGSAGGGAGGSGSPGASVRGGSGLGAFGTGTGGQGGESCFASANPAQRAGGGGGGRFARDQGALVAERGGDGATGARGAESGLPPARGGAAGPDVFTDGDPSNDFFGIEPIVDASGSVVGTRHGELHHVQGGRGGGGGGDWILSDVFPPAGPAIVQEGSGGGGGGGVVVIRARGPIVFGFFGRIRANGGRGGSRVSGSLVGGACGGAGSGGHVILESATAIDFTDGNPNAPLQQWIQAIGGPRRTLNPRDLGFGGAGGPGVVQLHVPHPELGPGDPGSHLILPFALLEDPDPFASICEPRPHVLYPAVARRSRALSRWIPLGAAGEESVGTPASAVGVLFDGIETAPGEDEGRVQTEGGRVVELPPLLGPARLDEPGVELLADGASLALSGPVLAPLRASAQPISPDVYLRTPALLVGHTLRLANAASAERSDLTIADARYDDAMSRLTLALGGLSGKLDDAIAELGGAGEVELALVPRFFRVRQGRSGVDVLTEEHSVRILFQGAADDGTGRADEEDPLVDWTADVTAFGALAPGALDFVRFLVEFELDGDDDGFDPASEPIALDFLRLPLRF